MNRKNAIDLDWQKTFGHFLAVVARLQHETS